MVTKEVGSQSHFSNSSLKAQCWLLKLCLNQSVSDEVRGALKWRKKCANWRQWKDSENRMNFFKKSKFYRLKSKFLELKSSDQLTFQTFVEVLLVSMKHCGFQSTPNSFHNWCNVSWKLSEVVILRVGRKFSGKLAFEECPDILAVVERWAINSCEGRFILFEIVGSLVHSRSGDCCDYP